MVYRTVRQNTDYFFNGESLQVKTVYEPEIHRVNFYVKDPKTKETHHFDTTLVYRQVDFYDESHSGNYYILENYLNQSDPQLDLELSCALREDFKKRHKELYKNLPEGLSREKIREQIKQARRDDPYLNCLLVKYGYAITCHKSQGSEWPWVVIVSENQEKGHSDFFRWYYTAITRASERIYLVNEPHITPYKLKEISQDWKPILSDPAEDSATLLKAENTQTSNVSQTELASERQRLAIPNDGNSRIIFDQAWPLIDKDSVKFINAKRNPYQEHYLFSNDQGEPAKIVIYYNKKKITRIEDKSLNELSNKITEALQSLTGLRFDMFPSSEPVQDLGDDNLNEFLDLLKQYCDKQNISVTLIRHTQFRMEILFIKEDRRTIIDFNYDGNHNVTKFDFDSGSHALYNEIKPIFNEIR